MSDFVPVSADLYDAEIKVGTGFLKFKGLGQNEIMRLLSLLKYGNVETIYDPPHPPVITFTTHVRGDDSNGN